ncbi:MAG: NUDIX hydrolase [Pseudomonadota bacterium]|uniref:NUDIX hydrolase n=1 Tax=Phenylobacterium sp. TaxID=1871053 RepID=UPI00272491F0|nr:NUDIX hydrolase [Phenylobacterium sp.]MDO9430954.1 NUDIX hydrolase [Phenylobacterium sp.]
MSGEGTRPARQFAALPFTIGSDGDPRILLVTSRDTGRWVLPKGWPDGADATDADTARREAFEEAGIHGEIVGLREVGAYRYVQTGKDGVAVNCRVGVFALRVSGLAKTWPEKGQRVLRWCAPKQGARLVQEPELAALLSTFKPPVEF